MVMGAPWYRLRDPISLLVMPSTRLIVVLNTLWCIGIKPFSGFWREFSIS